MRQRERLLKRQEKQNRRRRMDEKVRQLYAEHKARNKVGTILFASSTADTNGQVIAFIFPFDCTIIEAEVYAVESMNVVVQIERPNVGDFRKEMVLKRGTNKVESEYHFLKGDIVRIFDSQESGHPLTMRLRYKVDIQDELGTVDDWITPQQQAGFNQLEIGDKADAIQEPD